MGCPHFNPPADVLMVKDLGPRWFESTVGDSGRQRADCMSSPKDGLDRCNPTLMSRTCAP